MPGLSGLLTELGGDSGEILDEVGTDLCRIEEATLVSDGHGGKTEQWQSITSDPLSCVAYPGSGRTHLLGEVPQSKTIFTVIVKGGVAVTGKHRVVILARDSEPERIVEITHVLPQLGVIVEIVGTVKI